MWGNIPQITLKSAHLQTQLTERPEAMPWTTSTAAIQRRQVGYKLTLGHIILWPRFFSHFFFECVNILLFKVRIYQRTDCCSNFIKGTTVMVGDTVITTNVPSGTFVIVDTLCGSTGTSLPMPQPVVITCPVILWGKIVTIGKDFDVSLSFSEAQIYGLSELISIQTNSNSKYF